MTKPQAAALAAQLIVYASEHLWLKQDDEIYVANNLMDLLNLREPSTAAIDAEEIAKLTVPDSIVEPLCDYAEKEGLIKDACDKSMFAARLMGLVTPMPSAVNSAFGGILKKKGGQSACNYLYNLSIYNNYVQKTAIDKNLYWKADCGNNYLEITVNLSKPEKSNADTAKLLTQKTVDYPKCVLCPQNLGYPGEGKKAARQNLRYVPLTLAGEDWFLQYSPYAYYREHCIAVSKSHVPMDVNEKTFEKLADFVDYLPNYFMGSNASLPVIGGSILNHEHYQGGLHLMPMHFAPARKEYACKDYADVKITELDWYNNVLRLESKKRSSLIKCARRVYNVWRTFDAPEAEIYSHTDAQHNALSPIMRKSKGAYILDVIFRNNRASEALPDGIFHAAPEYHNIKKESIGLIEAMGLFILPGRLERQTGVIAQILSGAKKYDRAEILACDMAVHADFIDGLMQKHGTALSSEGAQKAIRDAINSTCENILKCTAVFRFDKDGTAYQKLLDTLEFVQK